MRFQVQHRTAYTYETPVRLGPQRVRLRPRGDNVAMLEHWELTVDPELRRRTGDALAFLAALNGHLHEGLEREIRAAGGPAASL